VRHGPPRLVTDPAWAAALIRVRESRVVLVLGESDTGKTSLVTYLANALHRAGRSVAVVDADVGQSEIGPPTTVGLGVPRGPLVRLGDAEVRGLAFVGATSPAARVRATVTATGRMADRARRLGVQHALVDTSGLVQGAIGQLLKRDKIDRVAPDLVVCLQRDGECEHILAAADVGSRPVLRLAAGPGVRPRSPLERRRRRGAAFATYFTSASPVELDLSRVTGGEPRGAGDVPGDLEDVVVGLDSADGETLGLGVVRTVDYGRGAMTVETPVPASAVATVRPSDVRVRLLGSAEAGLPPICTEVGV
jgi:polynucleotide 5'-hydroxyl-kinase GRC3/NOL9